jgi:hypothetical protein
LCENFLLFLFLLAKKPSGSAATVAECELMRKGRVLWSRALESASLDFSIAATGNLARHLIKTLETNQNRKLPKGS